MACRWLVVPYWSCLKKDSWIIKFKPRFYTLAEYTPGHGKSLSCTKVTKYWKISCKQISGWVNRQKKNNHKYIPHRGWLLANPIGAFKGYLKTVRSKQSNICFLLKNLISASHEPPVLKRRRFFFSFDNKFFTILTLTLAKLLFNIDAKKTNQRSEGSYRESIFVFWWKYLKIDKTIMRWYDLNFKLSRWNFIFSRVNVKTKL